MSSQLREININQALCRPDHLWGAERELVLITVLIVAMLIFLSLDMLLIIFAIIFWLLAFTALRMMAKVDPYMSKIYRRHILYQKYYPAHSTPYAADKKVYKGWCKT